MGTWEVSGCTFILWSKRQWCFLFLFLDIHEYLLPNVQKPVKTVQYDEFVLLFLTWPVRCKKQSNITNTMITICVCTCVPRQMADRGVGRTEVAIFGEEWNQIRHVRSFSVYTQIHLFSVYLPCHVSQNLTSSQYATDMWRFDHFSFQTNTWCIFNLCLLFCKLLVSFPCWWTSNYIMMQKPANASSKVPPRWQIWKRSSFDTFLANMANVHCNTLVANMAFPSAIYAGLRLCALSWF